MCMQFSLLDSVHTYYIETSASSNSSCISFRVSEYLATGPSEPTNTVFAICQVLLIEGAVITMETGDSTKCDPKTLCTQTYHVTC